MKVVDIIILSILTVYYNVRTIFNYFLDKHAQRVHNPLNTFIFSLYWGVDELFQVPQSLPKSNIDFQ